MSFSHQQIYKRYISIFLSKERIFNKFEENLLKIAKDENLKVTTYDNIKDLNISVYGEEVTCNKEEGKLAVGVYAYNKYLLRGTDIHYVKEKDGCWTLAHELGHHFCIKEKKDQSEESADLYIHTLAKQILTPEEFQIVKLSILVHSGLEKDLNLFQLVRDEFKLKNEIRKRLFKRLKEKSKKRKKSFWKQILNFKSYVKFSSKSCSN